MAVNGRDGTKKLFLLIGAKMMILFIGGGDKIKFGSPGSILEIFLEMIMVLIISFDVIFGIWFMMFVGIGFRDDREQFGLFMHIAVIR